MKARYTILTLIALLCVAMSIQTVAAEQSDGNQAPSVYNYIKKAAEDRQDELLYLLEEDISPQVMDSLLAALNSVQLAEETGQSDPEASLGYYMDALRLFRETWELYLEENKEGASTSFSPEDDTPEDPEVPEDLDEKIKETQVKRLEKFNEDLINEYMKIVDKVNDLTDYVDDDDTEEISTAVNTAKQKFNEVAKKIRKGEIDDVIDELDEEDIPFGDDFDKLLELEESITEKNQRKSIQEEKKTNTRKTKSRKTSNDEGIPGEDEEEKPGNGNGKPQNEPNLANAQKLQDEKPEEEPKEEPVEEPKEELVDEPEEEPVEEPKEEPVDEPEEEPVDEPEEEPVDEPEVEPQQEQEKEEKANKNQEPVTEDEPEDKQAEKKEDKLQREVEKLEDKIDKLEERLSKKKNRHN